MQVPWGLSHGLGPLGEFTSPPPSHPPGRSGRRRQPFPLVSFPIFCLDLTVKGSWSEDSQIALLFFFFFLSFFFFSLIFLAIPQHVAFLGQGSEPSCSSQYPLCQSRDRTYILALQRQQELLRQPFIQTSGLFHNIPAKLVLQAIESLFKHLHWQGPHYFIGQHSLCKKLALLRNP